ncbi:hypothetical protein K9U40_21495 [Xanthobacter autotrophicus]|uniref:TPM domain-containing protein n=1 Tax=Xanthobacter TaxID=279 RepID=UPI0024AC1BDB|nr:hypothetical protein [Xanthobacter autotrophicus]MDI4666874.1 hypothetical protein [Xanthobacter autotrophicus]
MSIVADDPSAADAAAFGLTEAARRRIAEAVAAAEARTAAEIRVVVARAPLVQHSFFPVLWASLVALVAPWLLVLAEPFVPFLLAPMSALTTLSAQAVLFVVLCALLMLPGVSQRVIPRLALKAAARSAAIETFLAYGIPQTPGRTGLLIFAAARERLVEVVADEALHGPLGPAAWSAICDAVTEQAGKGSLVDGLVAGVEQAGALLSGPLPHRAGETNALPDHVIVL